MKIFVYHGEIALLSPEYKKYTLAELYDVLAAIDAKRHPDNYQKLITEIARKEKLEKEKLTQQTRKESLHNVQRDKVEQQAITSYWDAKSAKRDQQQIITVLGFIKFAIILAVFCAPVYFNSFLLAPSYDEVVSRLAWFISIFAAVAYGISKFKYRRQQNTNQGSSEAHPIEQNVGDTTNTKKGDNEPWLIVLVAIIILTTTFFITSKSLPVIAHLYVVNNVKTTKLVTVNSKARRFRKKHCNGKVYLSEYRDMQLDYICGVLSKKTWSALNSGDKLKLYGSQSSIGFLVQRAVRVQ